MPRRRDRDDRAPVVLTVTDPATGAAVTTETLAAEHNRPRVPRRWVLLAVAGLALAVVVAVVVVWLRDEPTGGPGLPQAVAEQPAEAWTRDLDAPGPVIGAGEHVLVAAEDGLTGLGRDGEQVWRNEERAASYVVPSGVDDVAVVVGDGLGAVSLDDGTELWWRDAGDPVGVDGTAVLVSHDATLSRVDVRTGQEGWSVEGVESVYVTDDAAYVITDGELRRIDLRTGQVDWAVQVGDVGPPAAANDELVVLVGGFAVTAYDAANGAEAWSVDASRGSGGGLAVGVWSDERVYLSTVSYLDDGDSTGGEVDVRDRDGSVGTFEVAPDDDVYGLAVRAGDQEWFLDLGSGGLYDERLRRVADYDGRVEPADDGAYALGEDELAYYPYGDAEPAWTLPVRHGEEAYVSTADDLVLVVDGGTLTAYR